MAEDNNFDNRSSGQNNSPQKRSINVTQPKSPQSQMSNIYASRVSDYTLREQQSLEKLKKKIGAVEKKESKASKIKSIVAILLVVILIIILVAFLLLLNQKGEEPDDENAIRVSMEIENKSFLSVITEEGIEELRPIFPGDILPIRAYARNSNEMDSNMNQSEVIGGDQFVRFKIRFILDYEDRYEIIVPTLTSNWTKFNAAEEAEIKDGVTEDDHFYYFCGRVAHDRKIELFSELEFDGNMITIDDAGKYGQIQVIVESIDASADNLLNGIWPTAPKRWIVDTVSGEYDKIFTESNT